VRTYRGCGEVGVVASASLDLQARFLMVGKVSDGARDSPFLAYSVEKHVPECKSNGAHRHDERASKPQQENQFRRMDGACDDARCAKDALANHAADHGSQAECEA
jgi:hypothetical protein